MKNTIKTLMSVSAFLLTSAVYADTQKVVVDPNKRIKITIGMDSLNRIAMENYRITSIFGDEEAFVMALEADKGQAFLKPSEANGSKPISLSIMTENGLTQDVELIPSKESAQTIVFSGSSKSSLDGSSYAPSPQPFSKPIHQTHFPLNEGHLGTERQNDPFRECINLLKHAAINGAVFEGLDQGETTRSIDGIRIQAGGTYIQKGYKIERIRLNNTASTPIEIAEKTLYKQGDMGILIRKRVLKPSEETSAFILTRA